MSSRAWAVIRPTHENHRVTTLELFFDLVFVFALTQITEVLADDLSLRGAIRGLVLLALLWFAWCSYAWLGNQAQADEGTVRAAVVIATAAMFLVALAIPEAWADRGGGLSAPVVLAVSLAVVRLGHLGVYSVAALGDAGLRRQLARTAVPVGGSLALLIAGAAVGGSTQTAFWLAALAVDYSGIYLTGTDWRLPAPGHFAERHGLIVIVALGESIVAIGVGIADLPLTFPVLLAALLGLVVSVTLWWLYFDRVAMIAERALHERSGADRIRLARDGFTYLHFPMVTGVVLLALGLKKVLEYVSDASHHDLTDALSTVPACALYGGVASYLIGHTALRLRITGTVNAPRLAVAAALLLAIPVATVLPALAALGALAAALVVLVAVEAVVYAAEREQARHAEH